MQFKTKAEQIAHGLSQSYIGPDHKVIDMQSFYSALVQGLASPEGLSPGTLEFGAAQMGVSKPLRPDPILGAKVLAAFRRTALRSK
jgi:hypothetical protein